MTYALASSIYRFTLMVSIAFMLSGRFFFFGAALAAWVVAVQLLLPGWKFVRFMARQAPGRRLRVASVSSLLCLAFVGLLGWLPLRGRRGLHGTGNDRGTWRSAVPLR